MQSGSLARVWVSELNCSHFLIKLFHETPSVVSRRLQSTALNTPLMIVVLNRSNAVVYSHHDRKNINMLSRQCFSIWMKPFYEKLSFQSYLLATPLLNMSKSHHFTKPNQNWMYTLITSIYKVTQLYLKLRLFENTHKGTFVHTKPGWKNFFFN